MKITAFRKRVAASLKPIRDNRQKENTLVTVINRISDAPDLADLPVEQKLQVCSIIVENIS